MFSYDPFEVMPTPFAADCHAGTSDSCAVGGYFDEAFCSDFSCCGQVLPDLHSLLEHFEEQHVLPLPTQPRLSLVCTPGPHVSYILSYPQPHPPLHPDLDLPVVPDLPQSPTTSSVPCPPPEVPICLPPALLTVQRSSRREDDHRQACRDESSVGPRRSAKHLSTARVDPIARSRPLEQRASPLTVPADRRQSGREKAFRCPRLGCMKSYLNPNGLKYHLEKGTCTNADVRSRAQAAVAGVPDIPPPDDVPWEADGLTVAEDRDRT